MPSTFGYNQERRKVPNTVYGMLKAIELLARSEGSHRLDGDLGGCVDDAVASINPDWATTDRRRWAAKRVGIEFQEQQNCE